MQCEFEALALGTVPRFAGVVTPCGAVSGQGESCKGSRSFDRVLIDFCVPNARRLAFAGLPRQLMLLRALDLSRLGGT